MPRRPFFEQVYAVVRQIPKGKVTSYGRVAEMLGAPGSARAVGYAMSGLRYKEGNPEYNDVPWQRVINHAGRISIKGSRHSRLMQAELLRAEGVEVSEDLWVDLDEYLWDGLAPPEVRRLLEGR